MKNKIYFAFGIHCHQPVGNFDVVFEDVFQKAYQPFLDVVSEYPEFKINIHYTGILLEWIRQHHSAHISQIRAMADSGQAELLGGGFYEPILSVIPKEDAIDQINKLSSWVKEHLKTTANGMWMAERIWEPTLPSLMSDAGMQYTILDDSHFKYAGLKNDQLLGYYTTEDQGKMVRVFPINMNLRYTIPFQPPEKTLEYLEELAKGGSNRLVVFADDGEKFGSWPNTFEQVYKRKWLKNFIREVINNRDWIEMVHFSEALNKLPPQGRIYLPTASYAEMMHWALPSKAYEEYENFESFLKDRNVLENYSPYVRGGFWRNFFVKYPESNDMHKKMIYLSGKARNLQTGKADEKLRKAMDHIWAAQCNCGYWHGVFGGIYLGHLRHAIYENLLQAEKILNGMDHNNGACRILQTDYNQDGIEEILIETPDLNLYFDLENGGILREMDYLPASFNLLNTLSRRPEGYHQDLLRLSELKQGDHDLSGAPFQEDSVSSIHDQLVSKEKGLEKQLFYDFYERKTLVDHFIPPETELEQFYDASFQERGDFVRGRYNLISSGNSDHIWLDLERNGRINGNREHIDLKMRKRIVVDSENKSVETHYNLIWQGDKKLPANFAVEFNFALLAGKTPDRYFFSEDAELAKAYLASKGELKKVRHIGLVDEYNQFRIELKSSLPADIWRAPVETVSLSESGFEKVFQSASVLFIFAADIIKKDMDIKIQQKIMPFKVK